MPGSAAIPGDAPRCSRHLKPYISSFVCHFILQSLAYSTATQWPQAHQMLLAALRLAQPKGYFF